MYLQLTGLLNLLAISTILASSLFQTQVIKLNIEEEQIKYIIRIKKKLKE